MQTNAQRRWARRILALACVAPIVECGRVAAAYAQDQQAPVSLVVVLEPESSLDETAIRDAIARELGATITSDAKAAGGALVVQERAGHVAVSFTSPGGKRETRDLALPDDTDEAAHDVALVAVNLVRDQASAFIQPEPPAAPTPPAAAAAPPATTPAKKPAPPVPSPCERKGPFAPLGFDLVPFLGTPRTRNVSLALVGSLSDGINGIALAPAFNVDAAFVCGGQAAGALNVTAGPVSGFQVAGAGNVATGGLYGAQVAGAVNVAPEVGGAQIAGAANVASAVHGTQIAGAIDVATAVDGAQIAGAINVATAVDGAQIAGAINVATAVDGAQIAGAVNIAAGPVHGVQIGVINVAPSADFALGVINVATHGRFNVDAWGLPDSGLMLAGVKNGGAHYHYIYGVGIRPTNAHHAWGALGIGGHITPFDSLFVDVDAIAYTELLFDTAARNSVYQGRVVVGYRIVPGLSVFGGPTYNVLEAGNNAATGVAPGYSSHLAQNSQEVFRGWPGFTLGVEGF